LTKQPSHVSDEGFASDPLDYRPTTQGKDNLDKVMESWRLDRTDLYDPFTQSALDDEYQCEKWNYDQNTKLYKRLNQNFHGRVQLSQFEEQVEKLEAEAISQHDELSTLSVWYQEHLDHPWRSSINHPDHQRAVLLLLLVLYTPSIAGNVRSWSRLSRTVRERQKGGKLHRCLQ